MSNPKMRAGQIFSRIFRPAGPVSNLAAPARSGLPRRATPTKRETTIPNSSSSRPPRRSYSTADKNPRKPGGSTNPATTTTQTQQQQARLGRLLARLPRRLRPYASRLHSAPLSHAAAFLVLHELTAVAPLLALFGLFHLTDLHVAPVAWVAGRYGPQVQEGLARFERYFRRKGWFGFDSSGEEAPAAAAATTAAGRSAEEDGGGVAALQAAEGPYRVVVEVALAYAITKALLPLRIAASLWATPWFAGVLVRTRALFGRGGKR